MADNTQIRIDCAAARKQATELRQLADDVTQQLQAYQQQLEELETAWTGESAKSYLEKAHAKESKLEKVAKRLTDLAAAIEKTASIYELKAS